MEKETIQKVKSICESLAKFEILLSEVKSMKSLSYGEKTLDVDLFNVAKMEMALYLTERIEYYENILKAIYTSPKAC